MFSIGADHTHLEFITRFRVSHSVGKGIVPQAMFGSFAEKTSRLDGEQDVLQVG